MNPPYPPGYQFGAADEMLQAALAQAYRPDPFEVNASNNAALAEQQRQAILAQLATVGGLAVHGVAAPQRLVGPRRAVPRAMPRSSRTRLRALMAALGGAGGGFTQVHPGSGGGGYAQVHPDPSAGFRQVHPSLPWMLAR